MFELDREVTAWSEAVHAGRCGGSASVAELRDHLYCEIDRARAEGLPDERAFAAAVARLGPARELAAEHAKDRSLLGAGCALAARLERGGAGLPHRGLQVAHGILWATVTLATSLLLSRTASRSTSEWVLLLVLIPSWLGSEQILRRALRRSAGSAAR